MNLCGGGGGKNVVFYVFLALVFQLRLKFAFISFTFLLAPILSFWGIGFRGFRVIAWFMR